MDTDMKIQRSYVSIRGEYVPVDSVEFIDIYSDEMGYDVMKFKYEGKEHESYIVVR